MNEQTKPRFLPRLRAMLIAAAMLAFCAAPALAQEYEKVTDTDPTTIAANPFIAGAYGFIWVAVLAYIVYVARALGRVSREIEQLRKKLDS